MKIKKRLKEERKKIDEQILAEGQDLRDKLIAQYCVPQTEAKAPVKKNNYVKWIAAVSCVIVVCLVVGVSIALTQPSPPQYYWQNEMATDILVDDFELETDSTIIIGSSYSITSLSKVYDSVSLDKLYFKMEIENKSDLISGELNIVVNKYYHLSAQHIGNVQKAKFNQYDMEYSVQQITVEDIPMNEYFGCINYNDYKIYFSFQELRLDETASPQTVLNDLLILK